MPVVKKNDDSFERIIKAISLKKRVVCPKSDFKRSENFHLSSGNTGIYPIIVEVIHICCSLSAIKQ